MAITIACHTENHISVEQYVDFIQSEVDLGDEASLVESAPMLLALANDRNLVTTLFNKNIEDYLSGERTTMYTPQSFIIAGRKGRHKNFYVRGNIWPVISSNVKLKALEERVFTYNIAHDHDFYFMTVGYWGPGYETHIYEYDSTNVLGFIGEYVPMQLLEKTKLPVGKVMLYRPWSDIHIQIPPSELSISLNLMVQDEVPQYREQYFFDVNTQTIAGYPYASTSFNRCSVIQLASYIANARTVEMLFDIAKKDPLPRSRVVALEGLLRLDPSGVLPLLEGAMGDSSGLVSAFAKSALNMREGQVTQFDHLRNQLGLGLRSEVSTLARKSMGESIQDA